MKQELNDRELPSFCCSFHEGFHNEDFSSDNETTQFEVNDEEADDLVFLMTLPQESSVLHSRMSLKHETGAQCDFDPPVSLLELAAQPVVNLDPNGKVLYPRTTNFTVSHMAMLRVDRVETSAPVPFQCKTCFKIFNSGQALGGHMSRRHPANSESSLSD